MDDADFDFFETPRENSKTSPKSKTKSTKVNDQDKNASKHGQLPKGRNRSRDDTELLSQFTNKQHKKYSHESDSESDAVTPRDRNQKENKREKNNKGKKMAKDSSSGSSSAYSNSDISSDNSDSVSEDSNPRERETIDIHMPSAHVDAWSDKAKQSSEKNIPETKTKTRRNPRKRDSSSDSYSSDGSVHRQKDRISRNDRVKSAKSRNGRTASDKTHKHRLRSASSSYSNNSDITDVSPLESPENTPRRKKNIQQTSENGHFEKVQYRDASPLNESADIKLENEQIDLSILMKCMADIDKEKQQRIKTNSRRVMFAPPTNEKQKGNFSFSVNRANIIEKENQRLLNKIMTQMKSSGPVKKTTTISSKGPRKATEPVIQRLTPSAVNRMREQRRIEAENMHILNRLHSVKPTRGMSRQDQIGQFERQMSYGIPSGTMLITEPRLETRARSHTSLDYSSVPSQRSRPSSASSLGITTQGKRSRPSSAKSNASIRSNASVRSTASKRSTMSMRSNFSIGSVKRRSDKVDCRPEWNDRFSCA